MPHWQTPALHVPELPALQSSLPLHWHALAVHTNPGGQARPHAPQLAGVFVRSKQPFGV